LNKEHIISQQAEHIRVLESKIKELESKIKELESENESLREELLQGHKRINDLESGNNELKCRILMNSTNSSKPSSTNGFNIPKTKSLREKTTKEAGGQPGHKGHNIKVPEKTDKIVNYYPPKCNKCPNRNKCKSENRFECKDKRYVIEIVMAKRIVEHRTMSVICPCERLKKDSIGKDELIGVFPKKISAYIQYGDSVARTATILNTHGAMGAARVSTFLKDSFEISVSEGTVLSMVSKSSKKVLPTLRKIRKKIIESDICYNDETGIKSMGNCTGFTAHPHRN